MIIGHLPAGYVGAHLLFAKLARRGVTRSAFIISGLLGSVAPDFDMVYFHLVDHRQHHHHTYITHWPVVWGVLFVLSLGWMRLQRTASAPVLAVIFSLSGFVHMVLDSIVGDIWWFKPWGDKPYALATVPRIYEPWWLNFLLHWSFALEIAVVVWAIWLWRRQAVAQLA